MDTSLHRHAQAAASSLHPARNTLPFFASERTTQ